MMIEGQCPNCADELVDGLCAGCQHDGNRADCGCEYCSMPPTADISSGEVAAADTQYRMWLEGTVWDGPDLWDGNG